MSEIRRSLMSLASCGSSGGKTLVASGEFVGASSGGRQEISIGNKMAATDFYLLIKAKDGSEYERSGNYSLVHLAALVISELGRYTLTTSGTCAFTPAISIYDNNNGTLTEKTAGHLIKDGQRINNGNVGAVQYNTFTLSRNASDSTFHIYFGHSNQQYNLPSNVTYEYEVVYFGDDPANDIVTI